MGGCKPSFGEGCLFCPSSDSGATVDLVPPRLCCPEEMCKQSQAAGCSASESKSIQILASGQVAVGMFLARWRGAKEETGAVQGLSGYPEV